MTNRSILIQLNVEHDGKSDDPRTNSSKQSRKETIAESNDIHNPDMQKQAH
uniref:Uncharacterized protein n=1 Tax=Arundo donax TaxID=35708 RepID=A0A0A9H4H7_ARUDO